MKLTRPEYKLTGFHCQLNIRFGKSCSQVLLNSDTFQFEIFPKFLDFYVCHIHMPYIYAG